MKNVIVTFTLLLMLTQAGCIVLTEHKESTRPFGESARLAVRQQILNPEAGTDAPVVGLDGRYAESVAKKYQEGPVTEAKDGMSVSEIVIGAN